MGGLPDHDGRGEKQEESIIDVYGSEGPYMRVLSLTSPTGFAPRPM